MLGALIALVAFVWITGAIIDLVSDRRLQAQQVAMDRLRNAPVGQPAQPLPLPWPVRAAFWILVAVWVADYLIR